MPKRHIVTVERCQFVQARDIAKVLESEEIDPRIGLTVDELRHLSWDLVRGGMNQADRAREAIQNVYRAGHGLVFKYGGYGQARV